MPEDACRFTEVMMGLVHPDWVKDECLKSQLFYWIKGAELHCYHEICRNAIGEISHSF
jgi:hypothetical protein